MRTLKKKLIATGSTNGKRCSSSFLRAQITVGSGKRSAAGGRYGFYLATKSGSQWRRLCARFDYRLKRYVPWSVHWISFIWTQWSWKFVVWLSRSRAVADIFHLWSVRGRGFWKNAVKFNVDRRAFAKSAILVVRVSRKRIGSLLAATTLDGCAWKWWQLGVAHRTQP